MPLYEDEKLTREALFELRRRNRCKVCQGMLNVFMDYDSGKAFLACNDWHRTHHEGIEREAGPPFTPNIVTWREDMEQEYGKAKTAALAKYFGKASLQKVELQDVVELLWPKAPPVEKAMAIMLCASYGLNPANKHIFLIPFNEGEPNETWAMVMSIRAKRLLASRRGTPSYIDNTPRVMTEEEQMTVFGEVLKDRLYVITKLRDPKTGAEAVGYGFWFNKDKPKGEIKGNTRFNMAAIRSESQALDRLRPGEMPQGVEAGDEKFIDADFTLISSGGGEKDVPGAAEKKAETAAGVDTGRGEGAAVSPPTKVQPQKIGGAPPARDPGSLKTITDLFRACHEDFKMQPKEVLAELNVGTQSEISDPPADCYRKIAAVINP